MPRASHADSMPTVGASSWTASIKAFPPGWPSRSATPTARPLFLEHHLVHFDADGQHPPDQISNLLEPVRRGECDIALGSRFLNPDYCKSIPRSRRILLRGAVVVSGILTNVWLSDAHNGFRALSRAAAMKIRFREDGFAHATEFLDEVRRQLMATDPHDYDIDKETAASRAMLEKRIPAELNKIKLALVDVDKRKAYEPWRLALTVDLVDAIERNCAQLLQTMDKDRLPAAAWLAFTKTRCATRRD